MVTSRRVGSGRRGIASANVRLVFSRRSSSDAVIGSGSSVTRQGGEPQGLTPSIRARKAPSDAEATRRRRRIRSRVPPRAPMEERPASDFTPADAAVRTDAVGQEVGSASSAVSVMTRRIR